MTPIAALTAGGTGLTGIFDDLADGTSYGSVVASPADIGGTITVNLNAAALSDLNAATGLFAFGGALTSLGQQGAIEGLFVGSDSLTPPTTALTLTTGQVSVPEPSAIGALGALLIGSLFVRRRR